MSDAENGLAASSTSIPMVAVRPSLRRRLLAVRFGRYPSLPEASRTRATSAGSTVLTPLITRDTVFSETPASAATSRMVGLLTGRGGSVSVLAIVVSLSCWRYRVVAYGFQPAA